MRKFELVNFFTAQSFSLNTGRNLLFLSRLVREWIRSGWPIGVNSRFHVVDFHQRGLLAEEGWLVVGDRVHSFLCHWWASVASDLLLILDQLFYHDALRVAMLGDQRLGWCKADLTRLRCVQSITLATLECDLLRGHVTEARFDFLIGRCAK